MNHSNRWTLGALTATALCLALPASATDLLGDTLTFNRRYPTVDTPYWPNHTVSTTAAAGTSDRIQWYSNGNSGFLLTVDPEATSIRFNLVSPSSFIGNGNPPPFDGFTITGFGAPLTAAWITNNDSGLALTTSWTAQTLEIDLQGSNIGGSTGFTVNVTLVPEPATAALMLLGAAALAERARRRRDDSAPA
jgi:hypothetical protein